jgi:hypothetical protein
MLVGIDSSIPNFESSTPDVDVLPPNTISDLDESTATRLTPFVVEAVGIE